MSELMDRLQQAVDDIQKSLSVPPRIGIAWYDETNPPSLQAHWQGTWAYQAIPGVNLGTNRPGFGVLKIGTVAGQVTALLTQRLYYGVGFSMADLVFPIRLLHQLGVQTLILCDQVYGLNPVLEIGDILIVTDHINLMGDNPLVGANEEALGRRFPAMFAAYTPQLVDFATRLARLQNIPTGKGVYGAIAGPMGGTPAEYHLLHRLGCDAVGLSTVPENIAARHLGMSVLALSLVIEVASGTGLTEAQQYTQRQAGPYRLAKLITAILAQMTACGGIPEELRGLA